MASGDSGTSALGTVLVIGGCGFLGHHIVKQLTNYKCNIAVLDLTTTRNRHSSPSINYYDGNITSRESLLPIFQKIKPTVVIHTASPTVVGASWDVKAANALYRKVNVDGTRTLLEVSRETGVKAFVYTSSASVVCSLAMPIVNADERWPLIMGKSQPEYYTHTKAEAELLVIGADSPTFQTTALRPSGVFGEGDVQMLLGMLSAYNANNIRFQLGDNENHFDYTYVGNVAHAHILAALALTSPKHADGVAGEAFFITNDSPIHFWDFPRKLWAICAQEHGKPVVEPKDCWVLPQDVAWGIGVLLEWSYWALGKTPKLTTKIVGYSCQTRYFNCSKAKQRLGYKPQVDIEEGMRRGVKWYMEGDRWNTLIAQKKV